jgi:dynein heavy chain
MRAANLKTRLIAAKEEHTEAIKTVAKCRDKLAYARDQVSVKSPNATDSSVCSSVVQVVFWRGKVDRSCIERIKNFQNPPMLVGHVLEMVMTLIGKRLPSQRLEKDRDNYPAKDELSGRYTSSSSSTKFTGSVKKSELYTCMLQLTYLLMQDNIYTCLFFSCLKGYSTEFNDRIRLNSIEVPERVRFSSGQ